MRVKYFVIKYQIYPASVEIDKFASRDWATYDWDTNLEGEPIYEGYERRMDLYGDDDFTRKIKELIEEEGKKHIYDKCPEPKEGNDDSAN